MTEKTGTPNWRRYEAPPPKKAWKLDTLTLRVWANKVSDAAATVSSIGKQITEVAQKPTPTAVVGATISLLGTYVHNVGKSKTGAPEGWHRVDTGLDLKVLLDDFAVREYPGLANFGGQRVLIYRTTVAYCETSAPAFIEALRDYVWKKYNQSATIVGFSSESGCQLAPVNEDEEGPAIWSPRAAVVWARLEPMLEDGIGRRILLDGKPGTGKSTMARALVQRLGGTLLRVPLNKAGSIDMTRFVELFRILRPSAVIIDDFDRLGGSALNYLTALERLQKSVRLFLVTTNDLSSIDSAVVRAGRFDECLTVGNLGAGYTAKVLTQELYDELTAEQREKALDWPVVFLEELRLRFEKYRGRLAGFSLTDEFEDLACRVRRNSRPTWATLRQVNDDGSAAGTRSESEDEDY